MNTGIQDSYNLAWKLAFVLKGKMDGKILQTYNDERLENAKHLLQTTDRMFQFAAGSGWFLAFLRTTVFPLVANSILSFKSVKRFFFPLVSQIGIHYRHSSLSQHVGDENFKVKAGDRTPYFLVNGESIYNKLQQPRFHWLVFSEAQNRSQLSRMEFENQYAELIDFHAIPLDSSVVQTFGTDKSFNLLLRPDNYIGVISPENSLSGLSGYLNQFI